MLDPVGKYLQKKRNSMVLPEISGLLLDIGCGTNILVKEYGYGIGIDVHPWPGINILLEDTSKLPIRDESIDTVTLIAVLNHIPNRDEVLHEVHRILKSNGKLIITMIPPQISQIWHYIRKPWDCDQHERGMKEGEVYGMTYLQVMECLNDAGFKIIETKKFMMGINSLYIGIKKDIYE